MPPKKGGGKKGGGSKLKTQKAVDAARKKRVVEDKTFGLKNKGKSKKVQQFVNQVKKDVSQARRGNPVDDAAAAQARKKKMKEEKAEADRQMKLLFAQSIKQKPVPPGVDPKSVLCAFFKAGLCKKGPRCKFSHDLNVGRKSQKKSLHEDEKKQDDIDSWDQDKLESVVTSKHGNQSNRTTIVCKHFLNAIETSHYGWFWVCPNGGKSCKYRHTLPKGFVYKTRAERLAEAEAAKDNSISLEEIIEEKRRALPSGGTPVTLETFMAWQERKKAKKIAAQEAIMNEKLKKNNKHTMGLSGRALFSFDPTLFADDDAAAGTSYVREEGAAAGYDGPQENLEPSDDEEEGKVAADDAAEGAAAAVSADDVAVALEESLFLDGDAGDLDELEGLDL